MVTGAVPPTIRLNIGEHSNPEATYRYASYAGGSPGSELRFVYIVRPTDFDSNGISFPDNGSNSSSSTIFNWFGGSIRGEDGKTADRRYTGRDTDSEHKVKGSSVSLEGAVTSADGERIVLTFHKSTHGELFLPVDTELAAASADAHASVAVRVAGAVREVSGGEVVGGTALTLTLASPVETGEQVTVSYSRPASGARITDRAGNGRAAVQPDGGEPRHGRAAGAGADGVAEGGGRRAALDPAGAYRRLADHRLRVPPGGPWDAGEQRLRALDGHRRQRGPDELPGGWPRGRHDLLVPAPGGERLGQGSALGACLRDPVCRRQHAASEGGARGAGPRTPAA